MNPLGMSQALQIVECNHKALDNGPDLKRWRVLQAGSLFRRCLVLNLRSPVTNVASTMCKRVQKDKGSYVLSFNCKKYSQKRLFDMI